MIIELAQSCLKFQEEFLFFYFLFFQNLGIVERSFKNVRKGKSLNLKWMPLKLFVTDA